MKSQKNFTKSLRGPITKKGASKAVAYFMTLQKMDPADKAFKTGFSMYLKFGIRGKNLVQK